VKAREDSEEASLDFLDLQGSLGSLMRSQVTVVVPSYNQGQFLEHALRSIFEQELQTEVFVMDGGSTDNTLEVIRRWEPKLAGWRSRNDEGQAAAINEGMLLGTAPYVCWLNSDDWFLPGGLKNLVTALDQDEGACMVYGKCWNVVEGSGRRYRVWVEPFSVNRLALRCIISQPGTLIRRSAWMNVGGVDQALHLAMDYDLWWRLYQTRGTLKFLDTEIAVNRVHADTKTNTNRSRHYREAMAVVKKHYGSVPLKWWWAQPYAVWFKSIWRY
jgi:glycosyltransferase involved in cell wall biosynthesis